MSSEPRSARDALIAELLQDVLQLQDRVVELPSKLEQSLNPTADRIERAAAAVRTATEQLVQAGNKHQAAISEYVDKVAVLKIQQETELATRHLNEARSNTPAVEAPPQQAAAPTQPAMPRSPISWILAAAVVAFIAGFLIGRIW